MSWIRRQIFKLRRTHLNTIKQMMAFFYVRILIKEDFHR